MPELCLTGAEVLTPDGFVTAPLAVADGLIAEARGPGIDLSGLWVLPGIVDLHGDAFERHVAPRNGAGFDMRLGLASTDADLCANGVTTAYLAQSFSWEGGKRGPDYAERLIAALAAYRPHARADMRIQLRYETHFTQGEARMLAARAAGGIDYVVFNNHLVDAAASLRDDPQNIMLWAASCGRSTEEHVAILEAAFARAPEVQDSLERIAGDFRASGVRFGSHDDRDAATRARFHRLGADICEFPTTRTAAEAARRLGNPVLMGAPNVVRGGSQAGNVAALDLVADGLCDALVSDYYYPAMPAAVWRLTDRGLRSFEAAWAMISRRPAELLGLADRGRIEPGLRADLAVVNPVTRRIEATLVAGRIAHLAGEAALRILAAGAAPRRLAAE